MCGMAAAAVDKQNRSILHVFADVIQRKTGPWRIGQVCRQEEQEEEKAVLSLRSACFAQKTRISILPTSISSKLCVRHIQAVLFPPLLSHIYIPLAVISKKQTSLLCIFTGKRGAWYQNQDFFHNLDLGGIGFGREITPVIRDRRPTYDSANSRRQHSTGYNLAIFCDLETVRSISDNDDNDGALLRRDLDFDVDTVPAPDPQPGGVANHGRGPPNIRWLRGRGPVVSHRASERHGLAVLRCPWHGSQAIKRRVRYDTQLFNQIITSFTSNIKALNITLTFYEKGMAKISSATLLHVVYYLLLLNVKNFICQH